MKDVGILKQALPYIRKYKGRVFVVKLGGELVAEPEVLDDIAQDLSLIYLIGIKLVVVHGGGPQATELSKRLGVVPKFVEGRRVTDEESLEIVKMVLAGKINHEILTILRKHGVRSVGLSGIDGDVVIAERRSPVELIDRESGEKNSIDYGHVGDIKKINPDLLNVLLENGYVPVISSLADDGRGNILNINADTVASHIAVAMGAYKYITMTNVSGVLRDINDPESRISYMSDNEAEELINNGTIKGGMIPKIKECIYAVRGGVKRVHILNGFEKNSLLVEVFTRGGQGTMILGINEIEEYRKGDL
ncbi:MAG: acetylglutamate kinase [Spirochaetes bacterium]|nr:MAG: acetylglutamate kinase [Spirochaetota bacterium]